MKYVSFSEMPVWKSAFNFVMTIYKTTQIFPTEEKFGLISDMRRAANSITHNIAEGFGRFEKRDKTRFYKIARGSAYELQSQLMVSHGLKYINKEIENSKLSELEIIIKELNSMIKAIESKP